METVNIVIPAFNSEATVNRAIRSALDQKGVAIRIVVVDHGSTDQTLAIAQTYATSGLLEVLSLSRSPKEKRSASRPLELGFNHILQRSPALTKEWVLRLDADDVLASDDALEALLAVAPESRLVYGLIVFFSDDVTTCHSFTVQPRKRTLIHLLGGAAYSVPHHAGLVRCDLMATVKERQGFLLNSKVGYGEDFDFTMCLLQECQAQDVSFSDIPVCYKSLDGETISRTASRFSIAKDHVDIMSRHDLLLTKLFFRVLLDLILQQVHISNNVIRTSVGYPGKVAAQIQSYPGQPIADRLAWLDRGVIAQ